MTTGIRFSQRDHIYIQRASGNHPYLVQVAAAALFDVTVQSEQRLHRYVEANRLVLRLAGGFFAEQWHRLKEPAQRLLHELAEDRLRGQLNIIQSPLIC